MCSTSDALPLEPTGKQAIKSYEVEMTKLLEMLDQLFGFLDQESDTVVA